jgi:hypothetical protein
MFELMLPIGTSITPIQIKLQQMLLSISRNRNYIKLTATNSCSPQVTELTVKAAYGMIINYTLFVNHSQRHLLLCGKCTTNCGTQT